ncbi:MAG TPA: phosphatase PAP2 family protein [Crocinitomix sp.]|nr:phosphatase PAP2 family protein [Crocinitomix sp.]
MKLFLIVICVFPQLLFGQTDSLSSRYDRINWTFYELNSPKKPLFKKSVIPLVLTTAALSVNHFPLKQTIQDEIRAPFKDYTTNIDDYIQYAPIGIMYGADFFKLKAEHHIWNQTKFLFMSEALTGIVVFSLKYGLGIQRPDSSAYTSFPSGHTAQAFVAAQVLHNEFKNTNKTIAYSGYLFSTSTGVLRIINNKHWLPDVLLGAGIGILMTNIIYHFEPLKNWTPKFIESNKDLSLQFYPSFTNDYVGGHLKFNL